MTASLLLRTQLSTCGVIPGDRNSLPTGFLRTRLHYSLDMHSQEVPFSIHIPFHFKSPGTWRGYAHSLLCNSPGSNEEKATEIRDRLHEAYNSSNWVVFVSNNNEASAFAWNGGENVLHENTCGKAMFVWTIDNLIPKTNCSRSERLQMQTLMRSAAAAGGNFVGDVRHYLHLAAICNFLISEIQNFGFDYHYIRVASRTGFWSDKFVTSVLPVTSYQAPVSSREVPVVIVNQLPVSRCMVNFRNNEYDIRVYIK